jgi:hypothetical protein
MISLPNPKSNIIIFSEDDCEHDDYMTAEDYERKEYERDGWNESQYDRQRW